MLLFRKIIFINCVLLLLAPSLSISSPRVIVNDLHENEIVLYKIINEMYLVTYSQLDNTLKIWHQPSGKIVFNHSYIEEEVLSIEQLDEWTFILTSRCLYRFDISTSELIKEPGIYGSFGSLKEREYNQYVFLDRGFIIYNSRYIVLFSRGYYAKYFIYDYKIKKLVGTIEAQAKCMSMGCTDGGDVILLKDDSVIIDLSFASKLKYLNKEMKISLREKESFYLSISADLKNLVHHFVKEKPKNVSRSLQKSRWRLKSELLSKELNEVNRLYLKEVSAKTEQSSNNDHRVKGLRHLEMGSYSLLLEGGAPYGRDKLFIVNDDRNTKKYLTDYEDCGGARACDPDRVLLFENDLIGILYGYGEGRKGGFYLYDVNGEIVFQVDLKDQNSILNVLNIGNYIFVFRNNGGVELFDKITNKLIRKYYVESQITKVSMSDSKNHFIFFGKNGIEYFYDCNSPKMIAKKHLFSERDYLVITSDGFFDGSGDFENRVHLVENGEPLGFDQLYDKLYRPDLVNELLTGDLDGKYIEAAKELNISKIINEGYPPVLSIVSPKPGTSNTRDIELKIQVQPTEGGIGKVMLKVNGVTKDVSEVDRGIAVKKKKQNPSTITRLLSLNPGKNTIEVIAYNKNNSISSSPATLEIVCEDEISTPPELHVLSIGVDKYYDKSLWLKYAVKDSRQLTSSLSKAGKDVYTKTNITHIIDRDATYESISEQFEKLSKQVKTNDLFVLYMAGHGITLDGKYHFLPVDFMYHNTDSIRNNAITQEKLQTLLSAIDAQKSLILLDTCNSGSYVEAQVVTRGIVEKTAVDKLIRATGRTVIAASMDSQVAFEGYKGHGVFTYSIIQALKHADKQNGNRDGITSSTELATFIGDHVPKITFEKWGYYQIPQFNLHGQNFPIGVVH